MVKENNNFYVQEGITIQSGLEKSYQNLSSPARRAAIRDDEKCISPFLVGAFINKRARLLQSLVFYLRQTRSDER